MKPTFESLLASVGSFAHYQGYYYLYQSVLLVQQEPHRLCAICKEVYQRVAQDNHTTLPNVHKNIRTFMNGFWERGGKKSFAKWTGCSGWDLEQPYPREFIEALARLVERVDVNS